jgi:hypothetical protein
MTITAAWLVRIYAKTLEIYPQDYRHDFADEMQDVFNLRVEDASRSGFWGLMQLALGELMDIPWTLLALYARDRRMSPMQKRLNRWFVHQPGSLPELILASVPFLVLFIFPGVFSFKSIENSVPQILGLSLLGFLALLLAALGIVGLLVSLPRWAMPYAGVLISLFSLLMLMVSGAVSFFFGGLEAPWWLRMVAFELLYLLALVITMILVIWLSQKISLTINFPDQVKQDRSLISFAMYGGISVFVLVMYEDITGAGLYILVTTIPVLIGTWIYLHQQNNTQRVITLAAATTIAMGIAFVANVQLIDWVSPVAFEIGSLSISRSLLSIILNWLMCEAMLCLPIFLPRSLSTKPAQEQTA